MWGAVVGWNRKNEVGHCSFTDETVSEPVNWMLYAGFLVRNISDDSSS